MKTLFSIIALVIFFAISSTGFGQISASSILVDSRFLFIENDYLYYDTRGNSIGKDSVQAYFSYSVSSNLLTKGNTINLHSNYKQPQGNIFTIHQQDVAIEFDTTIHQIIALSITQSDELHFSPIDTIDYWNRPTSGIAFTNVPYLTSSHGDTIKVRLNAVQLRELNQLGTFSISQYTETSGTRSYTKLENTKIISIPDSAYANINIVGNFPLSVTSLSNDKTKFILVNNSLNLKLSSALSNQNQPFPCFDLLGRKHNLEFLGTDGSASTYSVRSLHAGVYFVSDGREMVKFLVGE